MFIEKSHIYEFYGSNVVGHVTIKATKNYEKILCIAGSYMDCEEEAFTVHKKDLESLIKVFQDILREATLLEERST
jgi:hypothetical protein